MKKIISLVLALLMLMSLFSVSVFAEEKEKSELISFEQINRKETEHFILTANSYSNNGWNGGDDNFKLTISAKDSNIIITRIEADIGYYGWFYGDVGISGGEKRETGSVNNDDTVHIDNINNNTFSFSGGSMNINFKDITIYYNETGHAHNFGEDNKCTVCGLTKCEIERHHNYKDGFCTFCGKKYEEESFETIGFVQSNNVVTDHFTLTADYCSSNGWCGGDDFYKLTITSRNSNIIITRIEAVIGDYGCFYGDVGVSGGTKRETDSVNNGDTVHIDNINKNTFSFSGGSNNIYFKDITVYYKYKNGTGSTVSEGNIWVAAAVGAVAVVAVVVVKKKKKKN